MKTLSKKFMDDLTNTDGLLHPILDRVRKDHTLLLSIRKDYVNIYYRGGNILKLEKVGDGAYKSFFDSQYNKNGESIPDLPHNIKNQDDSKKWVVAFQSLKLVMDFYFSQKAKPEREFQQLAARENNDSTISNESEYFIADIEFADTELGAKFDMLGVKWLANQRKNGSNCKAALIEMKYGDGALEGSAGIIKHLKDMTALIEDSERYQQFLRTIESKFNQLDQLGLLGFNRCKSETKVKFDDNDRPEVIFILANHNPRSTKLSKILNDREIDEYVERDKFDLRFFVSSFAGYGLHSKSMLKLEEFRELLKRLEDAK
ncbi:MAG: hypothetical protein RW306_17810 [Geobacteraceae bacterium]|nr:hypothetical protein [Geobacteraceae bacterium]